MEYSFIIILLALLQYSFFGLRTGILRGKYNVPAPKMSGNETWERYNRVHLNTLEQLIVFVPALLMFSYFVSSKWAILPGAIYLVHRQIYSHFYLRNLKLRLFPIGFFNNLILIFGSLIGIVLMLIHRQ